jgi:hypothetical protein
LSGNNSTLADVSLKYQSSAYTGFLLCLCNTGF